MRAGGKVGLRWPLFWRFSLPVLSVAAATTIAASVLHTFGSKPNPFIGFSYLLAIMASAWWGGYGPGLVAIALSFVGAPYLLLPAFNPGRLDVSRIALTTLVSLLISRVAAARRHAEAALRDANEQLEHRIQKRTTELVAANEELRRSNEELTRERAKTEASNAALRRANLDLEQFAYSASHDLQEPIRNVALYSQIVGERYAQHLDPRGREFLAFVSEGAQRLEMLVTDLLAYTQTASGESEPALAIDANLALDNALSNLLPAATEAGAQIFREELPRLCIHEVHLQQLFQNIIGNAIKYRSDAPPRIRVSAETIDGYWRFSIEDNGIGISPEYKEKIFGVFKRLHHNGKYPGTGIGLAICQRLVERYGGRIWVESSLGAGSTFFFTIRNRPGSGSVS